ncbi:uncharacterized protein LOC123267506 [Cotesia glomerata]|uniref:Uncharacterized protein n=1 Tax=Cotesia glomerata TaxID=32391 RepID=A0AAV7HWP5_COTGL|nr:uncharacterized protein LOC123267506 [Cotesia glomerata]KAH0534424.1 hypothetical protein KQX54_003709 [Cotesia glomerata]
MAASTPSIQEFLFPLSHPPSSSEKSDLYLYRRTIKVSCFNLRALKELFLSCSRLLDQSLYPTPRGSNVILKRDKLFCLTCALPLLLPASTTQVVLCQCVDTCWAETLPACVESEIPKPASHHSEHGLTTVSYTDTQIKPIQKCFPALIKLAAF